jgi:hypothetical protein
MPGWLKIDPNFDPLRKSARFPEAGCGLIACPGSDFVDGHGSMGFEPGGNRTFLKEFAHGCDDGSDVRDPAVSHAYRDVSSASGDPMTLPAGPRLGPYEADPDEPRAMSKSAAGNPEC